MPAQAGMTVHDTQWRVFALSYLATESTEDTEKNKVVDGNLRMRWHAQSWWNAVGANPVHFLLRALRG